MRNTILFATGLGCITTALKVAVLGQLWPLLTLPLWPLYGWAVWKYLEAREQR